MLHKELGKYYAKLDGMEETVDKSRSKVIEKLNEEIDGFIHDIKKDITDKHPLLTKQEIDVMVKEVMDEYI